MLSCVEVTGTTNPEVRLILNQAKEEQATPEAPSTEASTIWTNQYGEDEEYPCDLDVDALLALSTPSTTQPPPVLGTSARGWEALEAVNPGLCLLFSEAFEGIKMRRAYLVQTTDLAEEAVPDEYPRLDNPQSLNYIAGWVVLKVSASKAVARHEQLSRAMGKLTGPNRPNTNNFVFAAHDLKHSSLKSAVPALEYVLMDVEHCLKDKFSRRAIFLGRHRSHKILLKSLERNMELWQAWLSAASRAGVGVTESVNPNITVHLTLEQSRKLQSLIVARYIHLRQTEELKRHQLTSEKASQTLREGLKARAVANADKKKKRKAAADLLATTRADIEKRTPAEARGHRLGKRRRAREVLWDIGESGPEVHIARLRAEATSRNRKKTKKTKKT